MADTRQVADEAIANADRILNAFRYCSGLEVNKNVALIQADLVQDAIDACGDEMLDGDLVELIAHRAKLQNAKDELIQFANRQESLQMDALREIHDVGA